MIYSKKPCYGDGQWHCPFPEEWVERMKRAAFRCKFLTEVQVESTLMREVYQYRVPPGDFLDGPQDARGLPVGYDAGLGRNVSCDIYDYDTIPDIVVTDGRRDYEYKTRGRVLTA